MAAGDRETISIFGKEPRLKGSEFRWKLFSLEGCFIYFIMRLLRVILFSKLHHSHFFGLYPNVSHFPGPSSSWHLDPKPPQLLKD